MNSLNDNDKDNKELFNEVTGYEENESETDRDHSILSSEFEDDDCTTYTKIDSDDNKDIDKIKVKKVLNSKENMSGELIRVILGSPSIKEGISFNHIQHLHQLMMDQYLK